ncbi:uncharacterized protein LAESUDRAFT_762039 [Laetiporus sulphureus 93-53]|uniref:Pentacotripeptide-repeat region of PRORP domain-containing protein n=1 Tax=Laetiporus sulphureus 93-53 TaxID=1314785 RepID=A0A165CQR9_9APHY|nr:uncharacterized protein LAESUDRAFT_762039 [Laetiporus sulphureus 93-53]KZT03252.1 hypothetical protein LAESUDRAFT_762039 [Laetiporus sulphureus 93-53]
MSVTLRLPPALLDLTLLRASPRLSALSVASSSVTSRHACNRYSHGAAMVAQAPAQDYLGHFMQRGGRSLSAQRRRKEKEADRGSLVPMEENEGMGTLTELEERVKALQQTAASSELLNSSLTYSEDDLLRIYEALLAIPASETPAASVPREKDDTELVEAVAHRLLEPSGLASASSAPSRQIHHAIVGRLQQIMSEIDSFQSSMFKEKLKEGEGVEQVKEFPTSLITNKEWSALARTCISAKDYATAELVLNLMKRSGSLNMEESINDLLAAYASEGNVSGTERVLHVHVPAPTELQRDLHVKSHIKATSQYEMPDNALRILHACEQLGTPAPQKSYTRTITALLSMRRDGAQGRAQAWDLFAHMRYVAHPQPDVALYTLMLRACSHPSAPVEPERALDLFTEMTVDRSLAPTQRAYTAAMYAFARSGEERYVHQAFRLAREMLDANRDAHGRSAFGPNRGLFIALLEGAKRIKDLARARWILAEMVKQTLQADRDLEAEGGMKEQDALLTETVMHNIFQAYASYEVPFKRSATRIVDDAPDQIAQKESQTSVQDKNLTSSGVMGNPDIQEDFENAGLTDVTHTSKFSHIPPQSKGEIVAEAKILFDRIVADGIAPMDEQEGTWSPFRYVRLTSRLLNDYLSVYYAHAPFDTWSAVYRDLFDRMGISRDARTYVDALERCSVASKADRTVALRFAEEVWGAWQGIEEAWRLRFDRDDANEVIETVNARWVERANTAMIQLLSLTREHTRALEVVRVFAERYPPSALLKTPSQNSLRSTRVQLEGAKPLVRLYHPTDVPDDNVPPLLTFTELELLKHRLVAAGDRSGIDYINWLCKSYEGSLRRRRDAMVSAKSLKARKKRD